jgi:PAS domain S-box-containing protein
VVRSPERTVFWRPDSPTNHVPNLAASRRFPLIRGTVVAHVPRSEVEVGILSVFPRVLPGFAVGLLLAIVGGVLLVRLRRSKEALEESFAHVRESESRFRSLTELSSDWYWEQDENLHLIGVTQAGGNVPRYTANLGKAFWEERAITPSSGAWDDLKAAMAARKPFRDFELQHTAHDATVRYLSISGMPILADDGAFRGYRGTARDISERKRAEELTKALAASEEDKRLKNEFLTNMSHELRTPLNAILGFTELVQAGEAGPVSARQREFLSQALSSGRHLLRLINDVLALTRMESGKLELHSEPVDVPALVGEVISNVKETAEKGRIQIRTEVDGTIGRVMADPTYLRQVLYNYLSNALKFTPAGGSVVVRARPEGPDAFALEVEDTGVGIEPEDLSRLFVEFQQLDAGYAKKYGGTGLGLALTKRLVEAQGGSVGVRSRPGQGSVFRAILPRRASPSGGAAREPV